MVLKETIVLFRSGDEVYLEERMERACLNDLFKLTEQIDTELSALPPQKRKAMTKVIFNYFQDHYGGKL